MFTGNMMKLTKPRQFQIRNEIILLFCADPDTGPLMRRALEAGGYPVLTADAMEQADELFRSFDGAIRLLIIDIPSIGQNLLEVIASLQTQSCPEGDRR